MSDTRDIAIDAVEAALSDHHLDEVAEMIERAQPDKQPSESPFNDRPGGYPRRR